ncbi:MAG: peptidoglycan DD-metalloendopeptidase family protein [Candidatus Latescibacteria bacterium]|nr:peptidoglycan DD-metalloendopeptidase family protein [bacterium]MBD3422918.1 peptidoglycan DD-metalloendopeptidase family protein [Candidatus Latescibacterota bacterium]
MSSRLYIKLTAITLLLTALFAAGLHAQGELRKKISDKEKELAGLREEIEKQREAIRKLKKEEKTVGGYLERLDRESALVKKLLAGLEEKRDLLSSRVDNLRESLSRNRKLYRRRLDILSVHLREMYKNGQRRVWQEMLSASNFAQMSQKYKFFVLLAQRDTRLIEDALEKSRQVEREKREMTEMLHKVSMAEREKRTELGRLENIKEERKQALREIRERQKDYQRRVQELAEAKDRLQNLINTLEERRKQILESKDTYGEPDFTSLKGKMRMPVEGRTVRGFGRSRHPEFGTVTFNSGIDIEVRPGSPVEAVARGRVEYAGELAGYGNCIILNHGDGYYTLYARTGNIFISKGEVVEMGAVIAETAPGSNFHFELRQSRKSMNPQDWMR